MLEMSNVQDKLRKLRIKWVEGTNWNQVTLFDAIAFLSTEVAEVLDLYLRTLPYDRNNPRSVTKADFGEELADVIFMACSVADILDIDLGEALEAKMNKMEKQRSGKCAST